MDSAILGADGRPLKKRPLKREVATPEIAGVRSLMQDAVAPGLTPARLAQILRSAEEGEPRDYLTLAEEMEEREFHYISVLGTRKRALQGLDIQVEEVGEDAAGQEIAEAVRDLVERPAVVDLIGDLADAIGKGFAVAEILWHTDKARWTPVEFLHRDPRFFVFDRLTRRQIRLAEDGFPEGKILPDYKFIRHVPRLKSGVPIRGGLAKPAAWAFIFKSYTLKDWAAFAEVYGMPVRVGKYGPSASEDDKRKLLHAVRNIGTDAAAVIPESMMIEFIEAGKGVATSSSSVFGELADYLDKQVSKLVLGQTMTSDAGGSLAQAKVHEEVRMDVLAADARQLETTINRDLIRPFVDLNFGPQKAYPRMTLPVAEPEDVKTLADTLSKLVPLGVRIEEGEIRDRIGFRQPEEGANVLGSGGVAPFRANPAPVPAQDQDSGEENAPRAANRAEGCCAPARNAAQDVEDELDALEGEALDDWEGVVDPVLAPIRRAASEANSFEDFLGRLTGLFPEMDAGPLTEKLARNTAIAKGLGDAGEPQSA